MRPSNFSCRASKLCAPSDTRVTPAARYSANCPRSIVPGFASSVISMPSANPSLRAHVFQQPPDGRRRKQAGSSSTHEDAGERPDFDVGQLGFQVTQQRIDVALFGQFLAQRVRIEVAVRAFLHAPREVGVQRERRRFHARAPKLGEKCARSLAAMAELVAQFRGHLRRGLRLAAWNEDRVVAETAVAAGRLGDRAFPYSFAHEWARSRRGRTRTRSRCDSARCAARRTRHEALPASCAGSPRRWRQRRHIAPSTAQAVRQARRLPARNRRQSPANR